MNYPFPWSTALRLQLVDAVDVCASSAGSPDLPRCLLANNLYPAEEALEEGAG